MAQVLGPYTLGDALGTLPFGRVVAAERTARREPISLLLLADDLAAHLHLRGLMRLAMARAGGLRHQAILRPAEFGEHDGRVYVAYYQRPDGTSLAEQLAQGVSFTPEQAGSLVGQVAQALDESHRRGLFHGLLAPDAVFVAEDARAVLVGVGLLAAIDEGGFGDVIGPRVDLAYVAPEQAEGNRAVASADGYALGALAYTLLIGHPPSDAIDDPDPTDDFAAATDGLGALGAVLRRQLNRSPALRYPSCVAFAEALAEALGQPAPSRSPSTARPGPSSSRPSSGTGLIAASPALLSRLRDVHRGFVGTMVRKGGPLVGGMAIVVLGLALPPVAILPLWTAIAILAIVLGIGTIAVVQARDRLGQDATFGQVGVFSGPSALERHRGRSTKYFLRVADGQRIRIFKPLFNRLRPLVHQEPNAGLWKWLTEAETRYPIDHLTAIVLPKSERVIQVRDASGRVAYRDPEFAGIDLGPLERDLKPAE